MQEASLAIVLLATILLLYVRPGGLSDWAIAAGGAGIAWAIGPLGLRGGTETLSDSANIVAFFLGLMLIAAGAEAAGLYARAAMLLGQRRTTRGRVAFVLVAGTSITAVLSNDATPLVLTPAIFAAGAAGDPAARKTAFAATFTADGASLLLPVSNPVNLLFFERFDMHSGVYLASITPAAVAGLGVLAAMLLRSARRDASPDSTAPPPRVAARPIAPAVTVICALGGAYIVAALAGFPLGAVTIAGGVAMLLAARLAGPVEAAVVRRHIGPGVLIFVASLLLLVENVGAAGLLEPLSRALERIAEEPALLAVLGSAVIAAVLSNAMNNWPAAILLAAAIEAVSGPHEALVAGALIGCTIGANFTMLGSLSTVFWANLARRSGGASFGHAEYARAAFLPTLGALLAACAVAALLV